MSGQGNSMTNCTAYGTGYLLSDRGDRGGIGVYDTQGVVISDCHVHDIGYPGENTDAAVSIVKSPNVTVQRCLIKNAARTGIQFAQDSDNCRAFYNVIDAWGVFGTNRNYGIRIGGSLPGTTAQNNLIYNNLFCNGPTGGISIKVERRPNAGLQIINNIFTSNRGAYEIQADSTVAFLNWALSNNLYNREGNLINWNGRIYDHKHLIGELPGYFSFDTKQASGSLLQDPLLSLTTYRLQPGSPCIGTGKALALTPNYHGAMLPIGGPVNIGPH
jgi:hypothetical protein